MADEVGPSRLGGRRVSRTSTGGVKKAAGRKKSARATGTKAVDTIPRLDDYPNDDSESAIEKMLEEEMPADLNGAVYAEDLGRILSFVNGLPLDEKGAGVGSELLEECARILQDEVEKARHVAASRKGMPRA